MQATSSLQAEDKFRESIRALEWILGPTAGDTNSSSAFDHRRNRGDDDEPLSRLLDFRPMDAASRSPRATWGTVAQPSLTASL